MVLLQGGGYSHGPYNGCSHARNMSSFAERAMELARHGCNMDLRDKSGQTGLDLARQEGHSLLITLCKLVQKLAFHSSLEQLEQNLDLSLEYF